MVPECRSRKEPWAPLCLSQKQSPSYTIVPATFIHQWKSLHCIHRGCWNKPMMLVAWEIQGEMFPSKVNVQSEEESGFVKIDPQPPGICKRSFTCPLPLFCIDHALCHTLVFMKEVSSTDILLLFSDPFPRGNIITAHHSTPINLTCSIWYRGVFISLLPLAFRPSFLDTLYHHVLPRWMRRSSQKSVRICDQSDHSGFYLHLWEKVPRGLPSSRTSKNQGQFVSDLPPHSYQNDHMCVVDWPWSGMSNKIGESWGTQR